MGSFGRLDVLTSWWEWTEGALQPGCNTNCESLELVVQRKLWRGGPASWLVDQLSLHPRSVGCSAICVHSRTLSFDIEMTMHVVLTKILGLWEHIISVFKRAYVRTDHSSWCTSYSLCFGSGMTRPSWSSSRYDGLLFSGLLVFVPLIVRVPDRYCRTSLRGRFIP